MVVSNYYVENGLDLIAREIKRRLRDNKDVVLAITGYEGSGITSAINTNQIKTKEDDD